MNKVSRSDTGATPDLSMPPPLAVTQIKQALGWVDHLVRENGYELHDIDGCLTVALADLATLAAERDRYKAALEAISRRNFTGGCAYIAHQALKGGED